MIPYKQDFEKFSDISISGKRLMAGYFSLAYSSYK
jgi:hypothetical protein